MKIKVKLFNNAQLPKIINKGDWIDLRSNDLYVEIKSPQAGIQYTTQDGNKRRDVDFQFGLINLGVAMKLPKGFEALIAPRSSSFLEFGIIQWNSIGVIDSSYCGDNDQWKFGYIAIKDGIIEKDERICQFRIQPSQKATPWQKIKWLFVRKIKFVPVNSLNNKSRGGFGTTGTK